MHLGGRVLLDGELLGTVATFTAGDSDEVKSFAFGAEVGSARPARLRLEAPDTHLRVRRVVVQAGAVEGAGG